MNAVTEVMDELRKALAELEDCRARNADLRTMLEQVTRERDEALAACPDCAMWAERSARWHDDMQRAERERDEARAEVERLRETKDYLRTWLSSEELEGLRVKAAEHPLLWEEIHHLKAEVERLREKYDSVLEANVGLLDGAPYVDARAAFRRGAEAMRLACQQWCRAWENDGEAIADALADLRVEEP